jgi:ketosteroid isomerase-like protein
MANFVDAESTLKRFVERINAHDPKKIIALCTADHVFINSLGFRLSGHEQLEEGWSEYFSLFPDYQVEIESMVSRDSFVLACGFASATHAPSQTRWRIPAAWRAIVANGRIAEWQVYADNKPVYELLSQPS